MDMKKIKAIIFDLNGVFVKSLKLSDRFRRDFGIEEKTFLPALHDVMSAVRQPNAGNAYVYWKPYLEKWDVPMNEEQFLRYWFSAENNNPEMVQAAEHLKAKGVTLFILSNNLRERTAYYNEHFPFLRTLFKKVYYSWQTGFIKPDRQAFELLLKENDLRPQECLYFDDSEKNVLAAREMGIESYLFLDAADVEKRTEESMA